MAIPNYPQSNHIRVPEAPFKYDFAVIPLNNTVTFALAASVAVTFATGTPGEVTHTGVGEPPFNTGVVFAGTLPPELTAGVIYYISSTSTDTYNVAATPGGALIPFTTTGGAATARAAGVVTQTGSTTLPANTAVVFTGTLPPQLTAGVTYYLTSSGANTYNVAAEPDGGFIYFSTTGGAATAVTGQDISRPTDSLYIGGTGNLTVLMEGDGASALFSNVAVGYHKLSVRRVMSTGTTATLIRALYF